MNPHSRWQAHCKVYGAVCLILQGRKREKRANSHRDDVRKPNEAPRHMRAECEPRKGDYTKGETNTGDKRKKPSLGWMMGIEPTTTGATIRGSTTELHPPQLDTHGNNPDIDTLFGFSLVRFGF